MVRINILILTLLCLCSFQNNDSATISNSDLTLSLSNIRNSKGSIYVFLYSYENQYPYKPYKHYKVAKNKVKDGLLTVTINNLESKNSYAIGLLDDENNNADLDKWLGIPKEGYGFSNNVKPFLSLPDYDDLLFEFKVSKKINIKLQYVL